MMVTWRMPFQSGVPSPISRQMDSSASRTAGGGFAIDRTSTSCCFLIDLTACNQRGGGERSDGC